MDVNLPLSPPVNNNIQISLHDRLDAIVFEKIRVANTQLDTRLSLQEKIINKYRKDAEKIHAHQTQLLKREVKKIRQKKPDYVYDDSETSTSRSKHMSESTGRQRCLSEPSNISYCRRYYAHHYNVRDTSREEKKEKNNKNHAPDDFFNLKLRLYFLNVMNKAYEKTKLHHSDGDEYLHHVKEHGYDYFEHSRHRQESHLHGSFDRNSHSKFMSQTSLDYESDDVFESSYKNIKDIKTKEWLTRVEETKNEECEKKIEGEMDNNKTDLKISCDVNKEIHEVNCENNKSEMYDDALNTSLPKLKLNPLDISRGHRKNRNRKVKRKSFIGTGSKAEIEHNENERRKSKHAFEKIFAGLM